MKLRKMFFLSNIFGDYQVAAVQSINRYFGMLMGWVWVITEAGCSVEDLRQCHCLGLGVFPSNLLICLIFDSRGLTKQCFVD